MKAKLLLLEDESALNETIAEYLQEQGYEVVAVFDGDEAQERLYETSFDLLLLDVNVPGVDGFSLLKAARASGTRTPAIFLTSRSALADVEDGFDSGADDYLRKPFALKELLLRIENLLKRNFYHDNANRIELGEELYYDTSTLTLYKNGETVTLGDKESRLLKLFIQRKGELIVHEVIKEQLWDFDEEPSDDALRTYIKHLRQIVGKERIVSHKRLGYQFR
ncbi:response regulator transcription factor [bacterium]|jgi:DNA-binding response OmpR family regulator|nr:response regulator transcription factor [bacterium]